jgi:hypothetical protein
MVRAAKPLYAYLYLNKGLCLLLNKAIRRKSCLAGMLPLNVIQKWANSPEMSLAVTHGYLQHISLFSGVYIAFSCTLPHRLYPLKSFGGHSIKICFIAHISETAVVQHLTDHRLTDHTLSHILTCLHI